MTEESRIQHCYSDHAAPVAYESQKDYLVLMLSRCLIDIDRIIEMAWEDRTPFEAIRFQFGLSEDSVRKLMKQRLKFSSYKCWRMRVEACKTKHSKTRSECITRFKCSRQRAISQNKISKR